MNAKHVKGLAVVSIADGTKIGTVEQTFFDLETKRVVGFSVVGGESDAGRMIDASEVRSVGPGALMLDDAAVVRGAKVSAAASLVPLDELTKREVVTEGGTHVGQVASLEFDEGRFELVEIVVSTGFFKRATRVPAHQLMSVGDDVLVVADAVGASADPAPPGEQDEGHLLVGDVRPTMPAPASN